MGITFKENCPDIRNSKVIDIYRELLEYGIHVDIFDPWASPEKVKHEYDIEMLTDLKDDKKYDFIIIAVAHNEFLKIDFQKLKKENTVIFDTKAFIDRSLVDARL